MPVSLGAAIHCISSDSLPLTVDFIEKNVRSWPRSGGYLKREACPSEKATLTARMIDRPLRPSFQMASAMRFRLLHFSCCSGKRC